MKHFTIFKSWLAMLLLMIGVSASWAESVYKTALFGTAYNSESMTSYTNSWSATNGGFTVNLENWNNNGNAWEYVKTGSKNGAMVGTITTAAAIDKAITKVVMTIDALTMANVNSMTLYSGTSASNITTEEGSFSIAKGAQAVTVSSPSAGKFYKIVVDCKKGSSNGLVTVSKIEYYIAEGETVVPEEPEVTEYASLAALVAAGAPTTTGATVKVTLKDIEITGINKSRTGIYTKVGDQEVEVFCQGVPADEAWAIGGKVSGTLTCPWKLYNTTWELCPDDWSGLTYTAPEGGGTTDPDPETPVEETFSYTLETVGQGSVVFKDASGNVVAAGQKVAKGTMVKPTFTPATGWELSKWEYYSSTGEWKTLTDQFSITKDVKFKVTFTETAGGETPDQPGTTDKVTIDLTKDETTTATTDLIEWAGSIVTVSATKGSTVNANNYYPGTPDKNYTSTRFYTGATLTFTPAAGVSIASIVYEATTAAFATAMADNTWTNATAAVNGTTVTITPKDGTKAVSAAISANTGGKSFVITLGEPVEIPDTPDTPTVGVIPNFIKTSTLTMTVGETYDVRSCLNIPSDAGYDQFSITTSINGETAKKDEFACVYSKISFQKAGTYTVTVKAPAVEGKYAETTGTITVTVNGASVAEPVEMAIADFIAAGGSTEGVYLIGTVSNIKSTTYGNFDLTDESGTIYIYGCLTPEGQERQFASLGVVEGDKIKVLAKEYKLFNETKEAVNVVFVEKISGSTVVTYDITIAETENGTVKAPASAAAGTEVSVTVSPASGYKLDVLTVTDAKGNAVEHNGYKFIMPESAVTVSATFKAVDTIDFGEHSFVPNQVELTEDKETFSLTGSANGYTVVVKKNDGATTPIYNATVQDMRVYAKGTVTITSDEPFNEVVFAISEQGLKRLATITADCGNVAAQAAGDNTVTWTSEEGVTSVTFTVGEKADYGSDGAAKAGQLCFNYIDITPAAPATSGTLQLVAQNEDGYWATFSAKKGVFFKSADATVYTLTVDGEKVVATELSDDSYVTTAAGYGYYVPAGTGVLVKSSSTSVTYYMSAGSDLDELLPVTADNLLRPATEAMTGDCKFYRLAYDNYTAKTGLGFYYGAANGAAFTCKAGGAYLAVPAAVASVKGFTLGSLEDAIKNVEMAGQSGAIYDMQGRRVEKAQKGLYIVNGKKVVR